MKKTMQLSSVKTANIRWKLYGMFGASATSYGAIGENYILASGFGAKMAGGSWINTGEGGVIPEHLHTRCKYHCPNWSGIIWIP